MKHKHIPRQRVDKSGWLRVQLPKIRNVMPGVIAADICGVQPMTGPTGSIFKFGFSVRMKPDGTIDQSEGATLSSGPQTFPSQEPSS